MNGAINNYGSQSQYSTVPFIFVPSIMVAYTWQVLPGETVNFMDAQLPYMYRKEVKFSDPNNFIFEVFRIENEPLEKFIPQLTPGLSAPTMQNAVDAKQIEANLDAKLDAFSSKWDKKLDELFQQMSYEKEFRRKNNRRDNVKEVNGNE